MTKIFAICHQKGGTGKTTTTAHLGAALAAAGHNVLVIDMDPQASLTRMLGCVDQDCATFADVDDITDAVQEIPKWGLSLVPGTPGLISFERSPEIGKEQKLRLQLEAADTWDVVLIDAPGALGLLTTTALVAAQDGVIVPTTPDYLAVEPLATLMALCGQIEKHYQPGCKVVAIVTNEATNTRDAKAGAHDIGAAFGEMVIATVPRRTVISESASAGVPLTKWHTGPAAALREIYATAADRIMETSK